jgi:hypothetical protein
MNFDLGRTARKVALLMSPRDLPYRLCAGLGWLLVLASAVEAADAGLMAPSPFLPAGSASTAAAATGGPIEFHGYMVLAGGERFSIYDTAKKKATWVGLNEKGNQFVVRSYRVVGGRTDQITVDYAGGTLVLSLKEGKTTAVAAPMIPILGRTPVLSGVVAPAVQSTPPNLPAGASLEEWAAEVQRRRALRQQSGVPPDSPAPGPGQQPGQGEPQPAGP